MKIAELLLFFESLTESQISVEPMHELFQLDRLKIPTHKMLHNHEYCRFVKSLDGNASCADNKHRTMRIASYGHRFCGSCPYGIWELVQPVMFHGKLAAVIYFGPYIDLTDANRKPLLAEYDGPPLPGIQPPKKEKLKEYGAFFAKFIAMELEIVQTAAMPEKQHGAKYYCGIVRNLLHLRYMDNLRLEDAAKACHVNPNYLSNLLKASTDKTFRQLLTEQRLIEAQACLKYRGNMSVADIAKACGFQDSNYFSLVFHRSCGLTPTYFRKHWREDIRMARL